MIKIENGTITIEGTKIDICAETTILLKKLKEVIGCEMYKRVLELADMSNEEVHNEVEKVLDKIICGFLGGILNHGKKQTDSKEPNEDIMKELREAMKREMEETGNE